MVAYKRIIPKDCAYFLSFALSDLPRQNRSKFDAVAFILSYNRISRLRFAMCSFKICCSGASGPVLCQVLVSLSDIALAQKK